VNISSHIFDGFGDERDNKADIICWSSIGGYCRNIAWGEGGEHDCSPRQSRGHWMFTIPVR